MLSTLKFLCVPIAFLDVLFHLLYLKRSDSQRSINFVMDDTFLKGQIVSLFADSISHPCYQWIRDASIFIHVLVSVA